MSPARAVFLALLAIELPLVIAALSPRRRFAAARVLSFVVPLVVAIGFRAARAFGAQGVLEWDETYYVSLAVNAASGGGLYPYIYGFGPMHIMGGIGYVAYSYVAAVKVFGPTVLALRGVSLLVSVAGLAGIWTLVRTWYGSGTAWIAAATTASLQLFVLSNTARMDSWTFAWVAWSLAAFAIALERWHQPRLHLLAGLLFGLGLQVHIDTQATAAACGVVYFLRYVRDARAARRLVLGRHPLILFAAGLFAGGIIYAAANILPDTGSYYTTTVRVRVDATTWYSAGTASPFGSFLSPRILLAKEAARYRQLFAMTPALELALLAAALAAAVVRRNRADRIVLVLVPAVSLASAMLLNNASPLYYIHVLPAIVVSIAPLFTHGWREQARVALKDVGPRALIASVAVSCALCASAAGRTIRSMQAASVAAPGTLDTVRRVRAVVDRRCVVAGDGGLFVPYFADYPRFISLRPTELKYGMLFYGAPDEASYWRIKQPDAVFTTDALRPGLSDYLTSRRFQMVAPAVWLNPEGCGAR